MGCSNSKQLQSTDSPAKYKVVDSPESGGPHPGVTLYLPRDGPLKPTDYRARLESSDQPQTVLLPRSNYSITYAYVSQRGYYPQEMNKANQDAYCVHTCFNNNQEQLLFGVFDGHGDYGTETAQFARDKASSTAGPE